MTKRNEQANASDGNRLTPEESGATAGDALEQRVVAFAEQLGRIAGTVQAKAEGWLDREALQKQITTVRDGAAELLEHLAGVNSAKRVPTTQTASATTRGRSGGMVDAPGKKHRKPVPAGPVSSTATSQAAKMRVAKTMIKTNRHRGRG